MSTTEAALTDILTTLQDAGTIQWFRVDDDRKCTVSLRCSYIDGRPDRFYDDATRQALATLDAALKPLGLTFRDGGFEEDGSGEWWRFTA